MREGKREREGGRERKRRKERENERDRGRDLRGEGMCIQSLYGTFQK